MSRAEFEVVIPFSVEYEHGPAVWAAAEWVETCGHAELKDAVNRGDYHIDMRGSMELWQIAFWISAAINVTFAVIALLMGRLH